MVTDGARRSPDADSAEETVAAPQQRTQSLSSTEAGSKSGMMNGTCASLSTESCTNPIRFQLKTSKRVPDRALREKFENSDDDMTSKKLSRPRCVVFPTISEEEFLEVAGQMEEASLGGNLKRAFELVDFLLARKCDERVMEMKARLLLEIGQNFRAVEDCERAIKINPLWWKGHRMHGRSLLAMGELLLAVKAFERAVHINPADEDLRSEFRSAWKVHNKGPDGAGDAVAV